MADYVKVEIEFIDDEQKEILIALLSEMNYEGFEEDSDLIKAYVTSSNFNLVGLKTIATNHNVSFSITDVESRNWNQIWESNFQPVVINHSINDTPWLAIRADFHQPIREVEHEIIITPKMSFGTGHHASTYMMMKMMSELNFIGASVLDFGTGTGILAILSEKLGASKVLAIDNDDQSIRNATENFESNNCCKIELKKGSTPSEAYRSDIILANIVKSVILENLSNLTKHLNPSGIIVLGGLMKGDEDETLKAGLKNRLILKRKIEMEDWICLQMTQ